MKPPGTRLVLSWTFCLQLFRFLVQVECKKAEPRNAAQQGGGGGGGGQSKAPYGQQALYSAGTWVIPRPLVAFFLLCIKQNCPTITRKYLWPGKGMGQPTVGMTNSIVQWRQMGVIEFGSILEGPSREVELCVVVSIIVAPHVFLAE